MRGILYIAANDAFEEDLYKIGLTENFNIERRMETLNSSGVPGRIYAKAHFVCDEIHECERKIHRILDEFRFQNDREFFKCSFIKILNTIHENINQNIIEYYYNESTENPWLHSLIKEFAEDEYFDPKFNEKLRKKLLQSILSEIDVCYELDQNDTLADNHIPTIETGEYEKISNYFENSCIRNFNEDTKNKIKNCLIQRLLKIKKEHIIERDYEKFPHRRKDILRSVIRLLVLELENSFMNNIEHLKDFEVLQFFYNQNSQWKKMDYFCQDLHLEKKIKCSVVKKSFTQIELYDIWQGETLLKFIKSDLFNDHFNESEIREHIKHECTYMCIWQNLVDRKRDILNEILSSHYDSLNLKKKQALKPIISKLGFFLLDLRSKLNNKKNLEKNRLNYWKKENFKKFENFKIDIDLCSYNTKDSVRLISANGLNLGIFEVSKAIEISKEKKMNLVEVNPRVNPRVWRMLY